MENGQYCFANISTKKARILMKLFMVVNKYLVSFSIKFHEDPCINERAGAAHFIVSAHIYKSCACICSRIIMKFKTLVHKIVIDHHIKFDKDPSFHCGDICKALTLSEYFNFQCIFHIFTVSHHKGLTRWINTEWLWNFLESRYQNVPI